MKDNGVMVIGLNVLPVLCMALALLMAGSGCATSGVGNNVRMKAEAGDAAAQFAMGEGVPQDMVQGYTWLKLAGKLGNSKGLMGALMLERKMEIWDVNKG